VGRGVQKLGIGIHGALHKTGKEKEARGLKLGALPCIGITRTGPKGFSHQTATCFRISLARRVCENEWSGGPPTQC